MINAGVGKSSDPKNVPQPIHKTKFINVFQILKIEDGVVHNHPSGDPTPSQADIDVTEQIRQAGEVLGITLHDHLVIGKSRELSFRSEGYL